MKIEINIPFFCIQEKRAAMELDLCLSPYLCCCALSMAMAFYYKNTQGGYHVREIKMS